MHLARAEFADDARYLRFVAYPEPSSNVWGFMNRAMRAGERPRRLGVSGHGMQGAALQFVQSVANELNLQVESGGVGNNFQNEIHGNL